MRQAINNDEAASRTCLGVTHVGTEQGYTRIRIITAQALGMPVTAVVDVQCTIWPLNATPLGGLHESLVLFCRSVRDVELINISLQCYPNQYRHNNEHGCWV